MPRHASFHAFLHVAMHPHPTDRPRMHLAPHVRACRVNEQVILLDLQRGKYIGIGGAQVSSIGHVIDDWPIPATGCPDSADLDDQADAITALHQQQLLVRGPSTSSARAALAEPLEALDGDDEARRRVQWRTLWSLYRSSSIASAWIRRLSLADIAKAVADLRTHNAARARAGSITEVARSLQAYIHARPFVLSAHDKCLHESLTLIRFLATEGLFPQWVIGVKTRPFGAHAWVQTGITVLNDQPEHVRHFQPILVV